MVESVEHQFLSGCVTDVLNRLSQTNLYGYVEAERRKFDFACELVRDHSRPLVGQTLWSHTAGVDKDIRTMLLDTEAEICAYVARDTMKARRLLSEAVSDFRAGGGNLGTHRLRVFWVPSDFDADDEVQRDIVSNLVSDAVSRDIVMNILFGNLTPEDVRFFGRVSGTPGLHLAMLHVISTSDEPHTTTKWLSDRLGVSQGAIRERLLRLLGCGMLTQFGGGASWASATTKGRLFLDLCGRIWSAVQTDDFDAELMQILRLLEMRYSPTAVATSSDALHLAGPLLTEVPEMATGRIVATIAAAIERWQLGFGNIPHVIHPEQFDRSWVGVAAGLPMMRVESERYERRELWPRQPLF